MSPCVFWACVQRRLRPSPSLWLPLRLLFTFSEGIYFLHSSTPHFLKPSLALSPRLTPLFYCSFLSTVVWIRALCVCVCELVSRKVSPVLLFLLSCSVFLEVSNSLVTHTTQAAAPFSLGGCLSKCALLSIPWHRSTSLLVCVCVVVLHTNSSSIVYR